ncbi:MAG: SemiSWEET transporter [Candidatus Thermoplasmatota archaeon]
MDIDFVALLGFSAGIITSVGFIPQIIRGFRTKKLDDVSYYMPFVLCIGMTLWLIYGFLLSQPPIIYANSFGIGCNCLLLLLKKYYSAKKICKKNI